MAAVTDDRALEIADGNASLRFWRFVRRLLHWTIFPFFKVKVEGVENLNVDGPLVVAPVHRSNLDAPIVGALSNRRIRCLAKRSLFKNGIFGWVISALGAFPVDRGTADRDALVAAQRILEAGHPMLVFPEGTRQSGDEIGELFEGVVFLASRTNAPIVPIGIAGTEEALSSGSKFPKRTRVSVVIGEPLELDTSDGPLKRSARRAATEELGERLTAVMGQARANQPK